VDAREGRLQVASGTTWPPGSNVKGITHWLGFVLRRGLTPGGPMSLAEKIDDTLRWLLTLRLLVVGVPWGEERELHRLVIIWKAWSSPCGSRLARFRENGDLTDFCSSQRSFSLMRRNQLES
jgi:hypothetical protein